jgi:hypothetical protein
LILADKLQALDSVNNDSGELCVDLFRRPDGSFGFEEYRRDPEESRWYPVGGHTARRFDDMAAAKTAAVWAVAWFGGRQRPAGQD